MGQSRSSTCLKHKWQYIDTFGRFQVYRNQLNELGQKHTIKCNPKIDEQTYLQIYNQRNQTNYPIVSIFDSCYSNQDNDMSRNLSIFTVFSQYIPFRLSNINKLTHGQGMYVLSETLAGFSQLYHKMGAFQINQDLIGFNKDGEVKVWYNPNFADNSIQNDKLILMSTKNPYNFDYKFRQNQQLHMVEDIFATIAKYTNFNTNFLSDFQYAHGLGFNQARQFVNNQILIKKYYVPDHINVKGNNNQILLKSGIRSKHQIVGQNRSLNIHDKKQSYPFFMNIGTQEQYQNNIRGQQSIILGEYNNNIDMNYESRHNNISYSKIIPKPVISHHIIPSGRNVSYTTQQSIVHQLPAVREDYHNEQGSPRIVHRHKIFQNQSEKISS